MRYAETILDLIGDTPLVKLNRLADSRMATVLVKLENYNSAGSVKDRMAWNMVRRAEEAGLLAPGATLVESTSGNTGLGLAMTAAVRGYRCICSNLSRTCFMAFSVTAGCGCGARRSFVTLSRVDTAV